MKTVKLYCEVSENRLMHAYLYDSPGANYVAKVEEATAKGLVKDSLGWDLSDKVRAGLWSFVKLCAVSIEST